MTVMSLFRRRSRVLYIHISVIPCSKTTTTTTNPRREFPCRLSLLLPHSFHAPFACPLPHFAYPLKPHGGVVVMRPAMPDCRFEMMKSIRWKSEDEAGFDAIHLSIMTRSLSFP